MPLLRRGETTLHYEIHGNTGAPVLLIQGVGVAGDAWRPQIDALASQYRMLAYDHRGIGRSGYAGREKLSIPLMAADALALMDAAGWATCHVVGHSMGGVVAQRLALTRPNRVRTLSLLCTVARGADATRLTPATLWLGLRSKIGTRRQRRRAFLELIHPRGTLSPEEAEREAEALARLFGHDLADTPPVVFRQLSALSREDTRRELHRLSGIPTLVVGAEQDVITRPSFGQELAELIPDARWVKLRQAAHGVTLHRPELINPLLLELWQSSATPHQPALKSSD